MKKKRKLNCLATLVFIFFILPRAFGQNDTLYLSLSDALKLALRNSPARLEASVDKRSSILSFKKSVAEITPTPTLQANYTKSRKEPLDIKTNTYTGIVGLSQVLFDSDVLGNLYKSKLYYDYYRLSAQEKEASLVYSIKISYFALAKSYNLYEIAQASLRRAEENYHLLAERFRLGAVTEFELLRSETYKTQAQIDLLNAEKSLKITQEELKGKIGLFEDVLIKPTTTPSVPELEVDFLAMLENIWQANLNRRLSAKYKKIAQINRLQSLVSFLPSLSLFWQSSYSDSLLPKNITDWKNKDFVNYGFRLDFPIFEIKSYLLNLAHTRNEAKRAEAQLRKVEILTNQNALNAILTFKEARERYKYAAQNLKLNEELLRLAKEQYRIGSISQLELFDAELKFNIAQQTYISAQYDAYINYAQIKYLLGDVDYQSEK